MGELAGVEMVVASTELWLWPWEDDGPSYPTTYEACLGLVDNGANYAQGETVPPNFPSYGILNIFSSGMKNFYFENAGTRPGKTCQQKGYTRPTSVASVAAKYGIKAYLK